MTNGFDIGADFLMGAALLVQWIGHRDYYVSLMLSILAFMVGIFRMGLLCGKP